MSETWQLNPEDDRIITLVTDSNNNPTLAVTIGTIKGLLANLGFNSALLVKSNFRSGTGRYMILTNYGNVAADLYLGSSTFLSLLNSDSIGFSFPTNRDFTQYQRYAIVADGSRLYNQTGTGMNYVTTGKTVNNIDYRFLINDYATSDCPPIYITTYSGNIYYDGILPPTYHWVSVPSVSGKNGILSLAQIASGSINDGEPVSDAAATAFSDLPAECNVGEIIDDLLPYEESLVDVLVKYKVKGAVTGAFEYVKLVAKKGSIPKSVEDGDKVVDINPSKKSKLVTDLDEGSKYYFVIFEKDSAGQTAQSNEKSITTGNLPDGTIFEYTGAIQTFTAPKTGIYQLETWGAQGGDATDGTLTARGGYGAYAVGEVFLTQGDTLYINVGGQNGYGGGGRIVKPLLNATSYDNSIASNKWGQKHSFTYWSDYNTPGYMGCNYNGSSNYIGFDTIYPDTSNVHNIMALTEALDFSEYSVLRVTVEVGTQNYQWGYCYFSFVLTDTLYDHNTMGNQAYHDAIGSHSVKDISNTGSSSKTETFEINLENYKTSPQYIYLFTQNMNKLKITNIELIK